MNKARLIADSGGSKTDWILCDELGNRTQFTTESYHPHLMSDEWINSKKDFWEEYTAVYELSVHFYGSGCMQQSNRTIVKKAFEFWGIKNVFVQSDIIGAAIACFGEVDGIVGILGTGSVLAEIEQCEVKKIHGGLGYLLGDEGSGYAFGKILLQKYFHGQLSDELCSTVERLIGNREKILSTVYGPGGKKYIGDLSFIFSEIKNEQLLAIHEENIELFTNYYLPFKTKEKTAYFIGSYAFTYRELLQKSLEKAGWKLGGVIKNPIERITEYVLKTTF